MSWLEIIRRALVLIRALFIKLGAKKEENKKPRITKESADAQIARQRELYKKNHPEKR